MKQNRISITINRPVNQVFDFTTNPKNTPLWIPNIKKEISNKFPPRLNTTYKNTGDLKKWTEYQVVEYENNKLFTLSSNNNYFVRYTYLKLNATKTKMTYFEWVKNGELEEPFSEEILNGLKHVLENSPA